MERVDDRHIDFRIFKDVDSCETHYPAGAEIIGPGKLGGVMYVVKNGIVAVQIRGITIEKISDGSIFGEMGIVDPRPHSATVFAVTDVNLYVVNEQQFLNLVRMTPLFALRVMRILARRIRAMNMRLTEADRAVV
jgi:CRP-like cAMP-binding protein